jgi:hypothetical protein
MLWSLHCWWFVSTLFFLSYRLWSLSAMTSKTKCANCLPQNRLRICHALLLILIRSLLFKDLDIQWQQYVPATWRNYADKSIFMTKKKKNRKKLFHARGCKHTAYGQCGISVVSVHPVWQAKWGWLLTIPVVFRLLFPPQSCLSKLPAHRIQLLLECPLLR